MSKLGEKLLKKTVSYPYHFSLRRPLRLYASICYVSNCCKTQIFFLKSLVFFSTVKWIAWKNSLPMLWIRFWTVFVWNGIELQENLKSFLRQRSTVLFPVTALVGEFKWSQGIQGPTVGQSVWSENSRFGSSQKENVVVQSCSFWTDPTIHLEMYIVFSNDTKRLWAESFDILERSMLHPFDVSKCQGWFVVGKYTWDCADRSEHW